MKLYQQGKDKSKNEKKCSIPPFCVRLGRTLLIGLGAKKLLMKILNLIYIIQIYVILPHAYFMEILFFVCVKWSFICLCIQIIAGIISLYTHTVIIHVISDGVYLMSHWFKGSISTFTQILKIKVFLWIVRLYFSL